MHYTLHYTLHTIHYRLYTIHYTLYTTLHITHYTLYTNPNATSYNRTVALVAFCVHIMHRLGYYFFKPYSGNSMLCRNVGNDTEAWILINFMQN
jgi:hypothetical protein